MLYTFPVWIRLIVRLAILLIFKSHTLRHETPCMIQHGLNNNIPDGQE